MSDTTRRYKHEKARLDWVIYHAAEFNRLLKEEPKDLQALARVREKIDRKMKPFYEPDGEVKKPS